MVGGWGELHTDRVIIAPTHWVLPRPDLDRTLQAGFNSVKLAANVL
jgi:hypothetical protein